jgi:hypothetical protein
LVISRFARLRASDRPIVLLDVLLVGGRHITRSLEQDTGRVAFAESAAQTKFEILKAFDRFRAQVGRCACVFEHACIGELAQSFDRVIQLGRRQSLFRQIAAQCLGVVQALLGFAAELLCIFGRESATIELRTAAARRTGAVGCTTAAHLLSVTATLALALSLTVRLRLLLALARTLALLSLLPLPLLTFRLTLLALTLLSLSLLTLRLLLSLAAALLILLLPVLSALTLLRRSLSALTVLRLLTLLSLTPILRRLALALFTLLVAAFSQSTLRAVRGLLLLLTHPLVHRLETAHEIARTIRGLRLLALTVA